MVCLLLVKLVALFSYDVCSFVLLCCVCVCVFVCLSVCLSVCLLFCLLLCNLFVSFFLFLCCSFLVLFVEFLSVFAVCGWFFGFCFLACLVCWFSRFLVFLFVCLCILLVVSFRFGRLVCLFCVVVGVCLLFIFWCTQQLVDYGHRYTGMQSDSKMPLTTKRRSKHANIK